MEVNDIIRKYVGIPYVFRGRSVETGFDCYGLLVAIYMELGIRIPDCYDYQEKGYSEGTKVYIEEYYKLWKRVEIPEIYDGGLFNDFEGATIHSAVYVGENRMIHCYAGNSVVVSEITSKWKKQLYGWFRHIDRIKK